MILRLRQISQVSFVPSAFFIFTAIIVGCATGNCRKNTVATSAEAASGTTGDAKTDAKLSSNLVSEATVDRVKVYKYDGSLQCGQGKAISAEAMKKDFGAIQVFSATSKSDGLMHIMACGTPTGKANVFEIDRKNLSEALKKGFKEWTFE